MYLERVSAKHIIAGVKRIQARRAEWQTKGGAPSVTPQSIAFELKRGVLKTRPSLSSQEGNMANFQRSSVWAGYVLALQYRRKRTEGVHK